jgi:hypothetical protein
MGRTHLTTGMRATPCCRAARGARLALPAAVVIDIPILELERGACGVWGCSAVVGGE